MNDCCGPDGDRCICGHSYEAHSFGTGGQGGICQTRDGCNLYRPNCRRAIEWARAEGAKK